MVWVATAITAASAIYGATSSRKAAKDAASASGYASDQQAQAQMQALDYLKETNALPMQMRDQALLGLGAAYLPGGRSTSYQSSQSGAPQAYRAGSYGGVGPGLQPYGSAPVGYYNYGGPSYAGPSSYPSRGIGGGAYAGGPGGWDEAAYLAENPDVAQAVASGEIPSGSYHYHTWGKNEGRAPGIRQPTADQQAEAEAARLASEISAGEPLSPDWMYDRAVGSPLYEGLASRSQEDLLQQAEASPLYRAIMSGRKQGEDSILRNASATGGLRSGGSIESLVDYNTNLQNNALLAGYGEAIRGNDLDRKALATTYGDVLSGVRGLAQTPTNENNIATMYSNIGSTRAAGTVAAGQAQQQGYQNTMNNLMGIAGLGIQAYGARTRSGPDVPAMPTVENSDPLWLYSDVRLKENIRFVEVRGGLPWYTWDWKEVAGDLLGLHGESEGVLAHEAWAFNPESVSVLEGFLTVDYDKLGVEHA
jgi:hypothetical protein